MEKERGGEKEERKEWTKDAAVASWRRRSASTGSRWTDLPPPVARWWGWRSAVVGVRQAAEWGGHGTEKRRVELPLANVSCQSSRVSRRGSVLCVIVARSAYTVEHWWRFARRDYERREFSESEFDVLLLPICTEGSETEHRAIETRAPNREALSRTAGPRASRRGRSLLFRSFQGYGFNTGTRTIPGHGDRRFLPAVFVASLSVNRVSLSLSSGRSREKKHSIFLSFDFEFELDPIYIYIYIYIYTKFVSFLRQLCCASCLLLRFYRSVLRRFREFRQGNSECISNAGNWKGSCINNTTYCRGEIVNGYVRRSFKGRVMSHYNCLRRTTSFVIIIPNYAVTYHILTSYKLTNML